MSLISLNVLDQIVSSLCGHRNDENPRSRYVSSVARFPLDYVSETFQMESVAVEGYKVLSKLGIMFYINIYIFLFFFTPVNINV